LLQLLYVYYDFEKHLFDQTPGDVSRSGSSASLGGHLSMLSPQEIGIFYDFLSKRNEFNQNGFNSQHPVF
jgi:hypothetical protein